MRTMLTSNITTLLSQVVALIGSIAIVFTVNNPRLKPWACN